VVPKSLGGSNRTSNLVIACRPCHDIADREALHRAPSVKSPSQKSARPKSYAHCLCCHDYVSDSKLVGGFCLGCREAYGL
jgi:hypothetical protein